MAGSVGLDYSGNDIPIEEFIPRKMVVIKSVKEILKVNDEMIEIRLNVFRNAEFPDGETGLDFNFLDTIGYNIEDYLKEI